MLKNKFIYKNISELNEELKNIVGSYEDIKIYQNKSTFYIYYENKPYFSISKNKKNKFKINSFLFEIDSFYFSEKDLDFFYRTKKQLDIFIIFKKYEKEIIDLITEYSKTVNYKLKKELCECLDLKDIFINFKLLFLISSSNDTFLITYNSIPVFKLKKIIDYYDIYYLFDINSKKCDPDTFSKIIDVVRVMKTEKEKEILNIFNNKKYL